MVRTIARPFLRTLLVIFRRCSRSAAPDRTLNPRDLAANAVRCLGLLKFEPAKDRIRALSQADPDLAVRDASLEALKKY